MSGSLPGIVPSSRQRCHRFRQFGWKEIGVSCCHWRIVRSGVNVAGMLLGVTHAGRLSIADADAVFVRLGCYGGYRPRISAH